MCFMNRLIRREERTFKIRKEIKGSSVNLYGFEKLKLLVTDKLKTIIVLK